MNARKPISSAPMDGSKVTVFWTDRDDQENASIGQYRSLERMKATGGDWDESDTGGGPSSTAIHKSASSLTVGNPSPTATTKNSPRSEFRHSHKKQ
jgi:hypothetical protein